jgi:hypothetical protein
MLKFDDFLHLPTLDPLVARIVADRQGLVLVVGLDPRPLAPLARAELLPSGRSAVFRALIGEMLADGVPSAVVVAESRDAVRVSRALQRRVSVLLAGAQHGYAERIAAASARHPDLLIVDRLDGASAPAAFAAAQQGLRVLAQLDTVCYGADVARHLGDLGVPAERLGVLRWVVAVERLATLCPHCRYPVAPSPQQQARLSDLLRRCDGSTATYADVFAKFVKRLVPYLDMQVIEQVSSVLKKMKDGKPCPASQVAVGAFAISAMAVSMMQDVLAGDPVVASPRLVIHSFRSQRTRIVDLSSNPWARFKRLLHWAGFLVRARRAG